MQLIWVNSVLITFPPAVFAYRDSFSGPLLSVLPVFPTKPCGNCALQTKKEWGAKTQLGMLTCAHLSSSALATNPCRSIPHWTLPGLKAGQQLYITFKGDTANLLLWQGCALGSSTPGVSLLPACFIEPSLNKSYLSVSMYCGYMHLGYQVVQGLNSPCGHSIPWLVGWVQSHVCSGNSHHTKSCTSPFVLFWDFNNWKQQKLQTWIFQLIGRCPNQSKADMEKQTIVGYIKQSYL